MMHPDAGVSRARKSVGSNSTIWAPLLFFGAALTALTARAAPPVRTDLHGDPLPAGAVARLGSARLRHPGPVRGILFAPDGKSVWSCGDDGTVRCWSIPEGRLLRKLAGHEGPVSALALSGDGKLVSTGGADRTVRLWSAADGSELRKLEGHANAVCALAFSGDGKTLASAGGDETVRLWSVAEGRQLHKLEQGETVRCVAWSPDGRTLVAAGDSKTGSGHALILKWDAQTGGTAAKLSATGRWVAAIAVSPGGKTIAYFGLGDEVELVGADDGRPVLTLPAAGDQGTALAFSADGKVVLAAGRANHGFSGAVVLHRADTGAQIRSIGIDDRPNCAAFSRDGKTIAVGDESGEVLLLDAATGKPLTTRTGHNAGVNAVALSPAGSAVCSAGADATVRFWDLTGRETRRPLAAAEPVGCLALSPDGKSLAYAHVPLEDRGTQDRSVYVVGSDGKPRFKIPVLEAATRALAFSADGKTLIGCNDKMALFDAATGKPGLRYPADGQPFPNAVAVSPDGGTLVSLEAGKTDNVRLWRTSTGEPVTKMSGHDSARAAALSPDGRMLATGGGDGTIRLWEITGGAAAVKIDLNGLAVLAVAFSPDGRRLFAGAEDGAICVFDGLTGARLGELAGHEAAVTGLAMSADGRTLVSSSTDTTLLVWDLRAAGFAKPAAVRVEDAELDGLWARLAEDHAPEAFAALTRLLAAGDRTVSLIREKLPPVDKSLEETLARLIRELDDDNFPIREAASERLRKLGATAEPSLRKALAGGPSPEVRMRVKVLLSAFERGTEGLTRGEMMRPSRAIQILERLATPDARAHLTALAKGSESAPETIQARGALRRLEPSGR